MSIYYIYLSNWIVLRGKKTFRNFATIENDNNNNAILLLNAHPFPFWLFFFFFRYIYNNFLLFLFNYSTSLSFHFLISINIYIYFFFFAFSFLARSHFPFHFLQLREYTLPIRTKLPSWVSSLSSPFLLLLVQETTGPWFPFGWLDSLCQWACFT